MVRSSKSEKDGNFSSVPNNEIIDVKEKAEIKKSSDDEPSWYHYVIILLVFFVFFVVAYYGVGYYNAHHFSSSNIEQKNGPVNSQSFIYKYKVGNVTYNVEFQNTFNELDKLNYPIQLTRKEIWASDNLTFSFLQYNKTDNMYVSTASVKLMRFFKYVYNMEFSVGSFKNYNESNCSTSTLADKVMVFNPYSNVSGVFYNDSNGCIQVLAQTPQDIVKVGDKLLYALVKEK